MTKRKRYAISAAVLAACVGVALGVLAMMPPQCATKAKYNQIKAGMTLADVEAILWRQGRIDHDWTLERPNHVFPNRGVLVADNRDYASIRFDADGRVESKAWREMQFTYVQRFMRWLNWNGEYN